MEQHFLLILSILLLGSSCSNVGDTAPTFKLKTTEGYVLNSQNLQGKIIVVNVWATWCPTCIQEIPALNRLKAKYAGDTSIVFLGLCEEGTNQMNQVLKMGAYGAIVIQLIILGVYLSGVKLKNHNFQYKNLLIYG